MSKQNRLDEFINNPQKALLTLSLPMMAGMSVQAIYMLIDTAFIGKWVGGNALAGLGVIFPPLFIIMGITFGLGSGATTVIAQMIGKKDKEKAELDLAGYYRMIENLDYNVGRISQALKKMGIDRETYLVFFSDHGDMLGSHAQWGKSSPWEEAIRIPFIIAKVGGRYGMKVGCTEAVINHVDIAPTTLGLCGIPVPSGMVGYDYSAHCIRPDAPEYKGPPKTNKEPESAYLQQIPRKFHRHSVNKAWRGVITRDGWKYVCTSGNDWLLFNTAEDHYEQANYVYDRSYQEPKEYCHNLLASWVEETGDSFQLPDILLPQ